MANTWTASGANTPLMGIKNSDGSITLSGAELNAIQAIAVANQVIGGYSAIPATENQVITVGAGQNPWFVDIQGTTPLNQLASLYCRQLRREKLLDHAHSFSTWLSTI